MSTIAREPPYEKGSTFKKKQQTNKLKIIFMLKVKSKYFTILIASTLLFII